MIEEEVNNSQVMLKSLTSMIEVFKNVRWNRVQGREKILYINIIPI